MSVTTIKVDDAVRDRLAAVARARGLTLGGLLDAESRRLETEQHWAEVDAAYARLRADRDGWAEYLGELDAWDAGMSGTDEAAAEDWPEYADPRA